MARGSRLLFVFTGGLLERYNYRDQLFDAISGRGAFRMFRSTLDRLGLREDWYAYRHSAFEDIARDWLEEHNIRFE